MKYFSTYDSMAFQWNASKWYCQLSMWTFSGSSNIQSNTSCYRLIIDVTLHSKLIRSLRYCLHCMKIILWKWQIRNESSSICCCCWLLFAWLFLLFRQMNPIHCHCQHVTLNNRWNCCDRINIERHCHLSSTSNYVTFFSLHFFLSLSVCLSLSEMSFSQYYYKYAFDSMTSNNAHWPLYSDDLELFSL